MSKTIQFKKQAPNEKKYVEIIELITQKIITGEICPGDKLPSEVQFIEQLGMSRTPVREALKILEAMGVITIKRGEGIYLSRPMNVAKLNPLVFDLMMISNQKDKLVEFRQHFETMLLELASANSNKENLEKLRTLIEKQKALLNTKDMELWSQLDMDFHEIILHSTKNPFMIDIGHTVYELYRHRLPHRSTLESRKNTLEVHELYLHILTEPDTVNADTILKLKKLIRKNYKFSTKQMTENCD